MPLNNIIITESEYQKLLKEIRELQTKITELTTMRDDLLYHVCPAIRTEYEEKVVALEQELIQATMLLREKQRVIEIMQAQLNQMKTPSFEDACRQAKEETQEFEEEFQRRKQERQEFKEHWEQENQWSAHDRTEQTQQSCENENCGQENSEKEDNDERENRRDSEYDASGDDKNSYQSGASNQRETPGQRIKKLYRQIVKRLHPDVHPNPTEREKELLRKATEAYKTGDVGAMEQIWEELAGMDVPEENYTDTPENREKLRELMRKLQHRYRLLKQEIIQIKADYPYKMKAVLDDSEKLEQIRTALQANIKKVRKADEELAAYIETLREKLDRRGDEI